MRSFIRACGLLALAVLLLLALASLLTPSRAVVLVVRRSPLIR